MLGTGALCAALFRNTLVFVWQEARVKSVGFSRIAFVQTTNFQSAQQIAENSAVKLLMFRSPLCEMLF